MFVHERAMVHPNAKIGEDSKIWANASIRENAIIGSNTIIGENVYIGPGVLIGNNVKIQNGAQIYDPAVVEDGVFVGPGAILTNDRHPRAINPNGLPKSNEDWNRVGVIVRYGASIGAGAICVAPIIVGEWAMVAAGAVVVESVEANQLVAGIPARNIGEVTKNGLHNSKFDA
jgi:UDP-2-acetamido-3-amino-2,3-dideoxy-glucuronate N-acetyltransferase